MNTRRIILGLVTWLAVLVVADPAAAKDYRFQVEAMELQVYVRTDASVRMEYEITFANQPGAHIIDVVDVGLPHADYKLSDMSAAIEDQPLTTIRKSEYIDVGVEVPLERHAIMPGKRGTFSFDCIMPDMVYRDTTDKQRASLQIKPTWFDPSLQVGRTHLKIAVHLLPSVKADEVTYHREETRYKTLVQDANDGHVIALWDFPDQQLSSGNPKIGISFPRRGMDRVVSMSAVQLFVKWFREHPRVQVVSGVLLLVGWLFVFFRFSHGTGWVLGLGVAALLAFMMISSPPLHLLAWPVLIGLGALNEWFLGRKKRHYLPAMATFEGGGIKRGLTAPQAAVLLERPLRHVLTLVIFGLLKKGFVRVVREDPLSVEVVPEFRSVRKQRQIRARKAGAIIHGYEQAFLDRLQGFTGPVSDCDLSSPLRELVKSTVARMKGFALEETRAYYRAIVARAWTQAEAIGEIEQRTKLVDRNLEWMLLDGEWGGRFRTWDRGGYHYRPIWTHATPAASVPSASPSPSPSTSRTSFGEVASSFVGWTENTTGRLAAGIEPGSLGLAGPRGVLDLTVVDTITSDVFESLASGSGSGGGGSGGGCACACAGCACACACAGGGR